ncbi:MAG: hypothetical protein V3S14_06155 [Anaerolineae bacterium]
MPKSTWFARRVLDLISTLTDTYYTRKYGTMARQLGRPGVTPDQRRGFIIIQIDGLSYDHLKQAIDAGLCAIPESAADGAPPDGGLVALRPPQHHPGGPSRDSVWQQL